MGDIGGFGAKSQSKASKKIANQRIEGIENTLTPEDFLQRYFKIAGGLSGPDSPYEANRRQLSDAAAIGTSTELRGLDADAARRGLAGSGMHLAGRQSVRAGGQARANEALTDMYKQLLGQATNIAQGQQVSTAGAVGGVPLPQAAPSGAGAFAQGAGDILSLWLAFGGGG